MRVVLAADHEGFALKERLREHLSRRGHDVLDVGSFDPSPSDYPDHAEAAAREIIEGRAERAILVCGSGVGIAIAANKIPGILAGMCHDHYTAHQGVEHDEMNVLALGAQVVGEALAFEIAETFLAARFDGAERHARRVAKIRAIEARYAGRAARGESTS
jgi:ribose 5-phosphate isomerase B